MESIRYCKVCKTIWERNYDVLCCCGENIEDIVHCHVKDTDITNEANFDGMKCIPFIEDCIEHYEKCVGLDGDCHEECKCKERP